MKQKLTTLCAVLTAAALTGCAADTSRMDSLIEAQSTEETLLAITQPAATEAASETVLVPTTEAAPAFDASNGEYDVDLTILDSTMVYAECYDMVYNPTSYTGKKIRASGPFAYYKDPDTGNEYFAVLISDATACCSQGIEFVLEGEHVYPDDYPAESTEITVSGTFNYYEENGSPYVQLLDAVIESNA